jgi:two-component system chemotaxis response regulator CheB
MIVEDSPTVREYLCQAVSADPRLTLVAQCESAEQALSSLDRAAPDVISMDLHLSHMCGLEATRRIMETRPTPIVIVSRSVNSNELDLTMDALRAGAVAAIEKPCQQQTESLADSAARICRELAVMSQVRVVRQRFNQQRRPALTTPPILARRTGAAPGPHNYRPTMIGIVASTGGPPALVKVLASIGADFAMPILLVQHMTPGFHSGFVSWLDRTSPQTVVEARHGEQPEAGHVYVAPTDQHLMVRDNCLAIVDRPPVCGHHSSGTVLLSSMADSLGFEAAGVVLTGMGEDGAEGLRAIRCAGGFTIAEHASTAVVNGMPEAARALDGACISLPLDLIGPAIRSLVPDFEKVCI